MHQIYDFTLPRGQRPTFPDFCVGCRRPQPGTTLRVREGEISLMRWLYWFGLAGEAFDIPMCATCRRRLRWRRIFTILAIVIGSVAALFILMPVVDLFVPRAIRRIAGFAVVLAVVAVPYIFVSVVWPASFDMTVFRQKLDVEFRDPIYAGLFAAANGLPLSDRLLIDCARECKATGNENLMFEITSATPDLPDDDS